ncbi:hypothetical protein [Nitrospira sp. Nam80]
MNRRQSRTTLMVWLSAALLIFVLLPSASIAGPYEATDVFLQFTQHIRRQTDSDKREFAHASQCMNWFYRRERNKPAPPAVQGVSWAVPDRVRAGTVQSQQDCDARYPGGLDAVRQDFQRTQTSLSLSLTFYEFALVADGDDNGAYSAHELQDILRALELPAQSAQGVFGHIKALTGSFDSMHRGRSLEKLMAGMTKLYDQGYRFTAADKANLDRLME